MPNDANRQQPAIRVVGRSGSAIALLMIGISDKKATPTFENRGIMMLDEKLLEILACPECKGKLEYDRENSRLICHACRLRFAIEDDIPIMLSEKAEKF